MKLMWEEILRNTEYVKKPGTFSGYRNGIPDQWRIFGGGATRGSCPSLTELKQVWGPFFGNCGPLLKNENQVKKFVDLLVNLLQGVPQSIQQLL